MKSKQVRTVALRVTYILENYHRARNSDKSLISLYWGKQKPDLIKNGTASELIEALLKGELTHPDTITRARRKVCETRRDLRGTPIIEASRRGHEVEMRANMKLPIEKEETENDESRKIKTKIDPNTGQMAIGFEGIRSHDRKLH